MATSKCRNIAIFKNICFDLVISKLIFINLNSNLLNLKL